MNIKKQIILDDKDYERLVHDANLSDDEIKRGQRKFVVGKLSFKRIA